MRGGAESRPVVHKMHALFLHGSAAVGGFDLVSHDVRERHLCHFVGVVRLFGCPVAESAAEAVRSEVRPAHSFQKRQHRHVA